MDEEIPMQQFILTLGGQIDECYRDNACSYAKKMSYVYLGLDPAAYLIYIQEKKYDET